ncbi:DUF2933 domain-containing protein [Krasilnikovia sp. M28-CT-15]|uniref:DUF2933 domain-containing protein n=1 Tax=Krasilnikovia sp. M28-CT-15 TaxID=3373540 RepID=UPI003875B7C8
MRRQPWGLYAIAAAILVVGLVAFGVPASTLLVAAFALACPVMMMFMMAGMHSGHDDADQHRTVNHSPQTPHTASQR